MMLPPELYDRTIDFLWDDPRALIACSLTCSSWLPASRFHLFHTISLRFTGTDDCKRFEALLDASDARSTGVVRYIRELSASGWDGSRSPFGNAGSTPYVAVTPLAKILTRLTDVQHLTIKNAFVTLPNPSLELIDDLFRRVCAAPFYSTLTTLRLESVAFHNAEELRQLVSASPQLTLLDVRYPHWPSKAGAAPASRSAGPAFIKLTDLVVRDSDPCAIEMAGWLLEPPFDACLRTLDWHGDVSTTTQPVLRNLLERNAPSLEHVRLLMAFKEHETAERELDALSACTRLVTADFGCTPAHMTCIPDFLARIQSPHLQQLTITSRPYYRGQLMRSEPWDWDRIDEHVVRLHCVLPQLAFTFCFRHCVLPKAHSNHITNTVARLLPRARAASLPLVVQFMEYEQKEPYVEALL